ncbi:hypothetical protein TNCV_2561241 [Trichonephila clavipes]|uniref:Uncharacterized protein n=1 Tax=Trichonephila clavipes TaxID=2585209 RepID=A0A8X6R5K7_TRICX|nr:hypothetical protein TNCV_2561241 [Trichonephila clavipes]
MLLLSWPSYGAYSAVTGYMGRLRPSIPYLQIDVEQPLKFSCWEKDASDWLGQSFGKVPPFLSFPDTWKRAEWSLSDWIMACEEIDSHWLLKCLVKKFKIMGVLAFVFPG